MKIVFFGHDEISLTVLEEIRKNDKLLAVVVPANRSRLQVKSLVDFAKKRKIRFYRPKSPNSKGFVKIIRQLKPDLAIVYNYSKIFKKDIINIFPKGMINFHGALLPQYQGANVINWVIINGEQESGVTAHFITEKIDAGPIIDQVKFPIKLVDTVYDVKQKIAKITPKLVAKVLRKIKKGALKIKPQRGTAKYYPPRKPGDGRIDFKKNAEEIYNLARSLVNPWPGAYAFYGRKKIIFERTDFSKNMVNMKPATITHVDKDQVEIATGKGILILKEMRDQQNKSLKNLFKVGKSFR